VAIFGEDGRAGSTDSKRAEKKWIPKTGNRKIILNLRKSNEKCPEFMKCVDGKV